MLNRMVLKYNPSLSPRFILLDPSQRARQRHKEFNFFGDSAQVYLLQDKEARREHPEKNIQQLSDLQRLALVIG